MEMYTLEEMRAAVGDAIVGPLWARLQKEMELSRCRKKWDASVVANYLSPEEEKALRLLLDAYGYKDHYRFRRLNSGHYRLIEVWWDERDVRLSDLERTEAAILDGDVSVLDGRVV